MRSGLRPFALVIVALTACSPTAPSRNRDAAVAPPDVITLFNGRTLEHFETWLIDHHASDPAGVFTVAQAVDGAPAIRISGEIWGGLITEQAFRNYRLVVEYRWGGMTWGERAARARDSGVLLHAQGRLGNTASDFNGPWLRSLEFQIIEGGVGDFIPVAGYTETGARLRPSLTIPIRRDRDGERVYDPNGDPTIVSSGRVNWRGRSENWEDRLGFRGPNDADSPGLGWTRLEAEVSGGNLSYYVNGMLVLEGTSSDLTEGRIMIQSEGAELYVRRIEVGPLR